MESGSARVHHAVRHQCVNPALHFLGCFFRESKGKYLRWFCKLIIDDPRYALGYNACFAGAGARHYKKRPLFVCYGPFLYVIFVSRGSAVLTKQKRFYNRLVGFCLFFIFFHKVIITPVRSVSIQVPQPYSPYKQSVTDKGCAYIIQLQQKRQAKMRLPLYYTKPC